MIVQVIALTRVTMLEETVRAGRGLAVAVEIRATVATIGQAIERLGTLETCPY